MNGFASAKYKYQTCFRKQPYMTRDVAIKKAKEASKRTGTKIVPYICDICCNYHIGHISTPRDIYGK